MITYALIVFKGNLYRPAGFRTPEEGEYYISSDGKVRLCRSQEGQHAYKTILRLIPQKVFDNVENT